jgi:predicted PurR-regulated permease PerM
MQVRFLPGLPLPEIVRATRSLSWAKWPAALRWQDWQHPFYVLILYAVIVVVDGFLLQPYIMRRVARVPMWASILVPVVLGFVIPFWGFLLAPPLLAVIYAFKAKRITP